MIEQTNRRPPFLSCGTLTADGGRFRLVETGHFFRLEPSQSLRDAHILLTCVECFVAAAKVTGVLQLCCAQQVLGCFSRCPGLFARQTTLSFFYVRGVLVAAAAAAAANVSSIVTAVVHAPDVLVVPLDALSNMSVSAVPNECLAG